MYFTIKKQCSLLHGNQSTRGPYAQLVLMFFRLITLITIKLQTRNLLDTLIVSENKVKNARVH